MAAIPCTLGAEEILKAHYVVLSSLDAFGLLPMPTSKLLPPILEEKSNGLQSFHLNSVYKKIRGVVTGA